MSNMYENFYSEVYQGKRYGNAIKMERHAFYGELENWLKKNKEYQKKKFLEIGSGRGALQNVVENYTGIDYADTVKQYYHKRFICGSAEDMPFEDNEFDVAWSYAVWEHIPDPQKALEETIRVIKNRGHFILCPAWHCRPWFARGYQVRPYSDFGWGGKIYKFMIPFFDWLPLRMFIMFFKRMVVLIRYFFNHKYFPLYYKKLNPNYETFWQSDSDACNDLDPFFVILWFKSRNCKCISHKKMIEQFFSRTGTIEFEIRK